MRKNFIALNAERLREIFEYDPATGVLIRKTSRHGGKEPGCVSKRSGKLYRSVSVDGKTLMAHRIAWAIHYGSMPADMQIDHINGNGTDNRIDNLRTATNAENGKNQRLPRVNTSGRIGVCYDNHRKKWHARGKLNRTLKHLGYFDNFEEACITREKWEKENGFHPNHGSRRPL